MEVKKNTQIVKPVPGVFTFVGDDGKNLRDIVMELNNQWSFYMVKRVGDDAQLEALNETLEDVEASGVDRSSMAAVEALKVLPLDDHYPVNSYTLKRSNTQKQVACEEIAKQIGHVIINAIKTAIKWVSDKVSAFIKFFSDVMSKRKYEETDAFIKKIDEMGMDFNIRREEEIRKDPKLSAMAAAIEESYTVYADRSINGTTTINALGALIKNPKPLVDHMESVTDKLETLIKSIVTGKWNELDDLSGADVQSFKSQSLEALLKSLNVEGDSLTDRIRAGYQVLSHEQEEHTGLNIPYDTATTIKLCKQALENLRVDRSPFIYSEEATRRIVEVSSRVHSSLAAVTKLVDQARYGERDRRAVSVVRDVSDKLFESLQSLQFITDCATDFYDENRRWLKRLYMYLVYAQREEMNEE